MKKLLSAAHVPGVHQLDDVKFHLIDTNRKLWKSKKAWLPQLILRMTFIASFFTRFFLRQFEERWNNNSSILKQGARSVDDYVWSLSR